MGETHWDSGFSVPLWTGSSCNCLLGLFVSETKPHIVFASKETSDIIVLKPADVGKEHIELISFHVNVFISLYTELIEIK